MIESKSVNKKKGHIRSIKVQTHDMGFKIALALNGDELCALRGCLRKDVRFVYNTEERLT